MKQIFAEAAGGDAFFKVAITGRHHTDIHGDTFLTTDPLEGPGFEDAKQFGLDGQVDIRDFIEEERSPVGTFEAADALHGGPGKRAFFMAKQFALQQFVSERRAIEGHKRHRGPVATSVNRVRDQFFAGAGFPFDQDIDGTVRDGLDQLKNRLHSRVVAQHAVKCFLGCELGKAKRFCPGDAMKVGAQSGKCTLPVAAVEIIEGPEFAGASRL